MKLKLFTLWACCFLNLSVYAQGSSPVLNLELQNCQPDITKFCPTLGAEADYALKSSCLQSHPAELSVACRQDIEKWSLLRRDSSNRGGGSLGGFGGLNAFGPPVPLIAYDFRDTPGANSQALAVTENRFNISAPFFKSGNDIYSASLAASNLNFSAPVRLSSGLSVPTDLYRYELGGQFFQRQADESFYGLRASGGTAGDQPFQSANESTYSLNLNYGFPSGSRKDIFVFSVFLSNNSSIGNFIPVPGFIYIFKDESLSGAVGFPFSSLQWTPVYPWAFSAGYFGPTFQAEAAYGSREKIQFFSSFYETRQSYILAQFSDAKERLTLQELKISFGARALLFKALLSELQLGRSFNRSLFAGNGLFDDSYGLAALADDNFISLSLKMRF
jgi:hypothetical protein